MAQSTAQALALAAALTLPIPLAAHAELPPWVYGEQQRQAPVVAQLTVAKVSREAGELKARCKVVRVIRQPATGQLKPGQFVEVRYPLPPSRSPAMVGPAPLPVLSSGQSVTAWLQPIRGSVGRFSPAAGGRSFGPSMEKAMEPGS